MQMLKFFIHGFHCSFNFAIALRVAWCGCYVCEPPLFGEVMELFAVNCRLSSDQQMLVTPVRQNNCLFTLDEMRSCGVVTNQPVDCYF